jgi:hypothetical protein
VYIYDFHARRPAAAEADIRIDLLGELSRALENWTDRGPRLVPIGQKKLFAGLSIAAEFVRLIAGGGRT